MKVSYKVVNILVPEHMKKEEQEKYFQEYKAHSKFGNRKQQKEELIDNVKYMAYQQTQKLPEKSTLINHVNENGVILQMALSKIKGKSMRAKKQITPEEQQMLNYIQKIKSEEKSEKQIKTKSEEKSEKQIKIKSEKKSKKIIQTE